MSAQIIRRHQLGSAIAICADESPDDQRPMNLHVRDDGEGIAIYLGGLWRFVRPLSTTYDFSSELRHYGHEILAVRLFWVLAETVVEDGVFEDWSIVPVNSYGSPINDDAPEEAQPPITSDTVTHASRAIQMLHQACTMIRAGAENRLEETRKKLCAFYDGTLKYEDAIAEDCLIAANNLASHVLDNLPAEETEGGIRG